MQLHRNSLEPRHSHRRRKQMNHSCGRYCSCDVFLLRQHRVVLLSFWLRECRMTGMMMIFGTNLLSICASNWSHKLAVESRSSRTGVESFLARIRSGVMDFENGSHLFLCVILRFSMYKGYQCVRFTDPLFIFVGGVRVACRYIYVCVCMNMAPACYISGM